MSSGQEFILTAAMERSGEKDEHTRTAENKLQQMVPDLINFDLKGESDLRAFFQRL